MKRIVTSLALSVLVLLVSASSVASQEMASDDRYQGYPKSLIQWPSAPPDLAACQAGEYYEPSDFHLEKYASRVKVASVRVQNSDECSWMLTRNGWRWILRPEGTLVAQDARGRDLFDYGSQNGRACTNPRPFSVAIAPVVPVAEVERPVVFLPPAPPPPQVRAPMPAPDRPVRVFIPAPVQFVAPPQEEFSGWGVTGGGTLGTFSSTPISGIISGVAGRNACSVDGRTFDFGLAIGGPRRSFWRVTLMGMVIQDGSFTTYDCKDCGMQVTAVSQGMQVRGGSLERIFQVGSKDWKVRPMVSLHAGVGRVSGQALRYTGPIGGSATSVENVGADQLFGSKYLALAGGGVGFMGELGERLTYTVAVAGVEYPGAYYGRVQLTYWPKW